MYTIEYYKTKREKPDTKRLDEIIKDKKIRFRIKRKYIYQKDLIEKCWNIKSLTIDLEDIRHVYQDRKIRKLSFLNQKIQTVKFDDSITSITILNNNSINKLYIYEIINCKWMVNANQELDDLNVLKTTRKLLTLIDTYEKTTDNWVKRVTRNEIDLIKYYLDTITTEYGNKKRNTKSLKLGKHFIK